MKGRRMAYWLFVRIPLWAIMFSVVLVTLLKWVPVKYTPLMLKRAFQFRDDENYHTEQKWVSLEDISPEFIQSVVYCEDQRYWRHNGFDWEEIDNMWQQHRHEGTHLRGCSTISQQTAKNVFTFATPTLARKAIEAYWTCLIEWIWGKNRILEVYLNVAEMGKGIFGTEMAANEYYNVKAAELDQRQAIAIAVCLPHPLMSNPIVPIPTDRKRRTQLISQIISNKH